MKLEGFSVQMISIKLGLDIKTVDQYLGISAATTGAAIKSTYVEPKTTYSEPKPTYSEPASLTQARKQLAQDLSQLSFEQFRWASRATTPFQANLPTA